MKYRYHKRCLNFCAIVDLVIAAFYWAAVTYCFGRRLWLQNDGDGWILVHDIFAESVLFTALSWFLMEVYLLYTLLQGVANDNYLQCKTWIVIRFIYFVFGMAVRTFYLTTELISRDFSYWDILIWSLQLYSWYELSVAHSFVKHLKSVYLADKKAKSELKNSIELNRF